MTDQKSFSEMEHVTTTPDALKRKGKSVKPKNAKRVRLRDIQVTQDDIDKATRENSHSCMIAEAIKRQVPDVKNVAVDVQSIRFYDTKHKRRVAFLTPQECVLGLVRFDRGVPPKPFKFSMTSVQVTAVGVSKPKVGADGKPVMQKKVGRHVRKDGTVAEYRYETAQRETVTLPSTHKQFVNNRADGGPQGDHIIGGKLPAHHMPSYKRKFGLKAFTWNEDEDEAAIRAREVAAAGFDIA